MIPIRDTVKSKTIPWMNYLIIATCGLVFIYELSLGDRLESLVSVFGVTPVRISSMISERFLSLRAVIPLVTSMFLHGGWMHLIGNMWFLWLFGNNIEDSMGRLRFIVFYLTTGLAAAFGQVVASPGSVVPMIGASGAISGVMGAYLILYPRVKVYVLVPIFIFFTSIALPAWMMLGYWFFLQLASGLLSQDDMGGVAFWAHVGGFVAGIVLIKFFARDEYVDAHRASQWRPQRLMRDW